MLLKFYMFKYCTCFIQYTCTSGVLCFMNIIQNDLKAIVFHQSVYLKQTCRKHECSFQICETPKICGLLKICETHKIFEVGRGSELMSADVCSQSYDMAYVQINIPGNRMSRKPTFLVVNFIPQQT